MVQIMDQMIYGPVQITVLISDYDVVPRCTSKMSNLKDSSRAYVFFEDWYSEPWTTK